MDVYPEKQAPYSYRSCPAHVWAVGTVQRRQTIIVSASSHTSTESVIRVSKLVVNIDKRAKLIYDEHTESVVAYNLRAKLNP